MTNIAVIGSGYWGKNLVRNFKRNRGLISSLSNRMESLSIPDGASHNFPYETPDIVIRAVRDLFARIREAEVPAPAGNETNG